MTRKKYHRIVICDGEVKAEFLPFDDGPRILQNEHEIRATLQPGDDVEEQIALSKINKYWTKISKVKVNK
jgi:hypothetical protein